MKKEKYDPFRAIADPTRRKIISILALSGASTITAIAGEFDSARQVVTKHLYILESAGLISIADSGREKYCKAEFGPLKEVFDWVGLYEQFWDEKLQALQNHIASKKKKK